jgi:hypothetical protein
MALGSHKIFLGKGWKYKFGRVFFVGSNNISPPLIFVTLVNYTPNKKFHPLLVYLYKSILAI